jgi:hypothetical protein
LSSFGYIAPEIRLRGPLDLRWEELSWIWMINEQGCMYYSHGTSLFEASAIPHSCPIGGWDGV